MLVVEELSNEHIIRALRVLVEDLTAKHSPFNKDDAYLRNLAGWAACAATRIEVLAGDLNQARISKTTEQKGIL